MNEIKLCILKGGSGQTIMGKMDLSLNELDHIILEDVVQVDLAQDKSGAIVPVDSIYPHPFVHIFLTKKAADAENCHEIYKRDCLKIYDEVDIRQELIDWYQRVLAQKSGIEIVPKSNIILP